MTPKPDCDNKDLTSSENSVAKASQYGDHSSWWGVHKGRPNKEDLKQAAAFAEDMKEKISDE